MAKADLVAGAAAKARFVPQTVSSLQLRFWACSERRLCGLRPQHHEGRAQVWNGPIVPAVHFVSGFHNQSKPGSP